MRQTTHVKDRKQTAPPPGAGPNVYDLPVAHGVARPAPAPRPTWKDGLSAKGYLAILFVTLGAQALRDWSGWSSLYCYTLLYCVAAIFMYWDTPKPRQGFLPWTLKVVGMFLNGYFALVTVPPSLLGLLPGWLAFGLPAFLITLAFYWVPPLTPGNRTLTLRKWLLLAAVCAAFWAWVGPAAVM